MSKSSRYHGNQRKLAAAAICGSFVLGGTRARGDLVWDFSYVGTFPDYGPHYGTQDTASGELITTDLNNSNNTYTIVGISGTDNGATISALIAPGGYGGNDNLLYASSPYLDFDGFAFAAGGYNVELYYNAANSHYWDWYDYGATESQDGVFTVTQVAVSDLTWTNASGNGVWDTGTSSNWNNGTSTTVFTAQDNVTFDDNNGGAGNYAVTVNSVVSPGSITVDNSTGNYTFSGAGGIGGFGSLTKMGSGTLTLSTVNSFTGATAVDAGTLKLVGDTLPSPTASISPGAVLEYDESTGTYQSAITYSGAGTLRVSGSGDLVFGASGAVNVDFSAGGLIDVEGGTLTGSSSYGGNWTGNQASLNIAGGAIFNAVEGGASGTMQIDALTGAGNFLGGYSGNSNGGLSTVTIGVAGGSGTFSGSLQNNASARLGVIKAGSGTETFTGSNSYTGGTTVNAGTLVIGANGALPTTSDVSITGGRLQLAANTGGETLSSLSITDGGLDIDNNYIILSDPSGSIDSTIRGYLAAGYNGGNWNGAGIMTSAPTGTAYGIGYADGADGGISGIASGQLEVKYTLYGDTNLDGTVNSVDFGNMAANFGKSGTVWDQGDFDYDGVVNSIDFGLLAANFGKSASGADVALSASDWEALDAFAAANGLMADVPEPGSAALALTVGMGFLAGRRRRRARFSQGIARSDLT